MVEACLARQLGEQPSLDRRPRGLRRPAVRAHEKVLRLALTATSPSPTAWPI